MNEGGARGVADHPEVKRIGPPTSASCPIPEFDPYATTDTVCECGHFHPNNCANCGLNHHVTEAVHKAHQFGLKDGMRVGFHAGWRYARQSSPLAEEAIPKSSDEPYEKWLAE